MRSRRRCSSTVPRSEPIRGLDQSLIEREARMPIEQSPRFGTVDYKTARKAPHFVATARYRAGDVQQLGRDPKQAHRPSERAGDSRHELRRRDALGITEQDRPRRAGMLYTVCDRVDQIVQVDEAALIENTRERQRQTGIHPLEEPQEITSDPRAVNEG